MTQTNYEKVQKELLDTELRLNRARETRGMSTSLRETISAAVDAVIRAQAVLSEEKVSHIQLK